ncbi:MAG: hypothetical protein E6J20_06810 [Chloroflexi bacterium]|nr:MAG: hypothetical protein E6J20_06810 [Chloroflexota bacterium]
MPIYGYRCSSCGHQFEIQQRMADEPLKICPKCQGELTKILYPSGVIFKGSGYYSTDYRASGKEASGKEASGKEASSNGSSPSSETKPDSKPESKPESKSESSD